jgi:tellurite resistance protein
MLSDFGPAAARALRGVGPFERRVADAILEVAYLTMAVDQELRDEELAAFAIVAGHLIGSGPALDQGAADQVLDKYASIVDRSSILERLEAAARALGGDKNAKLAAYRVACLMAMSDLDAADREFEFDLDLIATLGLTQEEADEVADAVNAAVTPAE